MSDIATNNAAPSAQQRPVASDDEKALAQSWEKKIKAAKRQRAETDYVWSTKELANSRNYVNGKQHDDGTTGLVRTNIIHSTIATMLPMTYAKNPDIAVTPTENVEQGQYKAIRAFGKTLEIVLRRMVVRDGFLKKRAKSMVRSAMTTSVGWVKILYQREYGEDPIIMNRIADVQDNIKRIEYLSAQVKSDSGTTSEHDAKRAELEQQLKALEAQTEIVVAEGVVIDRILTEDMFILDESIRDFDAYPQARAMAHRVWFTKDQYCETFGYDPPSSAKSYKQPKDEEDAKNKTDSSTTWYAIFEIWDRASQTVYTKCEGADQWSRDPYQPQKLGERWYPYFGLAFNPIDGQFEPISDVQLLKELQDEYNTTRTNFAEHRKENLPGMVVRKGGGLNPDDIDKIVNRKMNEVIVVDGDPTRPIGDDLQEIKGIQIDPAVYDVSAIRNDMDVVVGLTDASRSNLLQAKTLGEAEIMRDSMMSRTSERQDTIEDCLQEMMQFSAEILLQELNLNQVKRIAGPGAQWPELSKDEVFDMVQIEIRAGTTGKPNKEKEREQWISFMPTFQEMVIKATELRTAGQSDLANSMVEMIKETLRRFDERLDIDLFLPSDEEGEGADTAQQLMEMKQQLDALMQENESLKPVADANQAKIVQGREANTTNIEVAKIEADAKVRIEADKNQSNERIEAKRSETQKNAESSEPAKSANQSAPVISINDANMTMSREQAQEVVASMLPLIEQVMTNMMGADIIPERDVATGKIVRIRRQMPVKQALNAGLGGG